MITQIQLKISLSEKLNSLLESRAATIGIPVTQFVKHLIIKEVEKEDYPVFAASDWLEEKTKKAIEEKNKAREVGNVTKFFESL